MSEFLIYQSENGRTQLDVRLEDETVWLSQKQLTELFGKAKGTTDDHPSNPFIPIKSHLAQSTQRRKVFRD